MGKKPPGEDWDAPLVDFNDQDTLRKLWEMSCKARTDILLANPSRKIVVPAPAEWWGVGMLERDDQLPERKNPNG